MTDRCLVWWIRDDLRLDDQRCLDGIGEFDRLIPVLCLGQRGIAGGDQAARLDGVDLPFRRRSPRRERFLHQGLDALARDLCERSSRLFVLRGSPDVDLAPFAARVGATQLRFSLGCGTEEAREEVGVVAALEAQRIAWRGVAQRTLIEDPAATFTGARLPRVFTDFRKAVERSVQPAQPRAAAPALPSSSLDAETWPVVEPTAELDDDPRATFVHVGGEAAAHARLDDYVFGTQAVARYKETRNGMLARNDITRLSPWLSQGSLSARRVHDTVARYEREHGANDSTYWVGFELLWRDFFEWTAQHHGARLFLQSGLRDVARPWRHDAKDFARWREGRTGDALVDAAMHELAATGFLSNRARQNAASFLIHDLGLDWRWGAAWFEHHLLDYSAASNYGNWQYIAGVGNDPRPLRRFDTRGQADRYDPDSDYRRHWASA